MKTIWKLDNKPHIREAHLRKAQLDMNPEKSRQKQVSDLWCCFVWKYNQIFAAPVFTQVVNVCR